MPNKFFIAFRGMFQSVKIYFVRRYGYQIKENCEIKQKNAFE